MGLHFRKSVKICKGVRMNFSTSGVGLSVGTKGCRYSVNSRGRRGVSVGIPGTGIYYTKSVGGGSRKRSYKSSAYAKRQQIQQQKAALQRQKQLEKEQEIQQNQLLVQEYENYIDVIRSVHKECDEPIDWVNINNMEPPFIMGTKGPKQLEAEDKFYNFKPNLIDKMLKTGGEKRKQKLWDAIAVAQQEDDEAYSNWQSMNEFSTSILNGNIDSYYMAIDEASPFEDLLEYGSDFEIGTDDKDIIHVEFRVKSKTVIPEISMSLTKTGALSKKNLTKTLYYDYTQDYVCSCAIRLARELFAILPVQNVIVHAVDNIVNTSTGNEEDCTILSVNFNRTGMENINYERIDASDFVESFEHNMKFMKTSGFKQVKRLGE